MERARMKVRQEDVAMATGLATNTVRRIESAERAATLDQLTLLADYFGISLGTLLDRAQANMNE